MSLSNLTYHILKYKDSVIDVNTCQRYWVNILMLAGVFSQMLQKDTLVENKVADIEVVANYDISDKFDTLN